MTQLRSVWHLLLHVHVLEKNIPVPGLTGRSIESLPANELERLTFSALRLRRSWSSPSPVATRHADILPTREPQSSNVALQFLPGRGNRWLLSITLTTGDLQRKFVVQCWDTHTSPPACVARRTISELGSFAINTDHRSPAILALQCPQSVSSQPWISPTRAELAS